MNELAKRLKAKNLSKADKYLLSIQAAASGWLMALQYGPQNGMSIEQIVDIEMQIIQPIVDATGYDYKRVIDDVNEEFMKLPNNPFVDTPEDMKYTYQ